MQTCNIDDCNIYRAQKYIKHKWVPIIIYCLNLDVNTFNRLLLKIDHISNSQLSLALRLLLDEKIIFTEDKKYFLTANGIKLNAIIALMVEFDY